MAEVTVTLPEDVAAALIVRLQSLSGQPEPEVLYWQQWLGAAPDAIQPLRDAITVDAFRCAEDAYLAFMAAVQQPE